jgi:hypothetical protein
MLFTSERDQVSPANFRAHCGLVAGVQPCHEEGMRMAKYRLLTGIDYPPNRRAEIGDEVTDLPASAVEWLLESGAIEAVDTKKSSKSAVVEEVPAEAPIVEEAE